MAPGRKGNMAKEICISSTPHETRLAILEDDQLAEIYYERENEYTLAGSIYKGRVTRVLPGMQSAFVDVGLERDAFLYVTDFLEEQEDSADFEKIPGGPRREASPERNQERNPDRNPASEAPEGYGAVGTGTTIEAAAEPREQAAPQRSRGRDRGR